MISTIEKINNINTHYQIEGENNEKTIVFIHGLSDDLYYWTPIIKELKDYKRINYDLRGHGKSECGNEEVTIETYTEDLYQLLIKLNIKETILVGLSLGGNIALNFAIKHPKMTKGLILMSTYSEVTPELKNIFQIFEKSIKKNFETFYSIILPFCLPPNLLKEYKTILEEVKHEKAKTANTKGILKGITAGPKFNITPKLNKIKSPTLILTGEDDEITPVNLQNIIHTNIKQSKMIIFPNTKHNILIEKNINKTNELIKEFLKNF